MTISPSYIIAVQSKKVERRPSIMRSLLTKISEYAVAPQSLIQHLTEPLSFPASLPRSAFTTASRRGQYIVWGRRGAVACRRQEEAKVRRPLYCNREHIPRSLARLRISVGSYRKKKWTPPPLPLPPKSPFLCSLSVQRQKECCDQSIDRGRRSCRSIAK